MGGYLAFKEIWRNRGRFFLFSMVIALITVLVVFVAGLTEGLGAGNREYLEKLNADLLVYDKKSDLLASASRITPDKLRSIRRFAEIKDAGPIAFSNVSILMPDGKPPLKVLLVGSEPGAPGEPPVLQGRQLRTRDAREVILERTASLRTNLRVGDSLTIRSRQGTDDRLYDLQVVGLSDGRQYGLQPVLFVPYHTWDDIRPQATLVDNENTPIDANIVALQLSDPQQKVAVAELLEQSVPDIQVVDRRTAYESLPGYSAQQSTLNTQRYFALLIGVLVIGGFFQIQTLQKVPQIGMLKAIGASNLTVGVAAILQILVVTVVGVGLGSVGTLLLSLGFPPTIPIVFNRNAVAMAVGALLLIGPAGGLVSIRYSLRVEPLTALGLST